MKTRHKNATPESLFFGYEHSAGQKDVVFYYTLAEHMNLTFCFIISPLASPLFWHLLIWALVFNEFLEIFDKHSGLGALNPFFSLSSSLDRLELPYQIQPIRPLSLTWGDHSHHALSRIRGSGHFWLAVSVLKTNRSKQTEQRRRIWESLLSVFCLSPLKFLSAFKQIPLLIWMTIVLCKYGALTMLLPPILLNVSLAFCQIILRGR